MAVVGRAAAPIIICELPSKCENFAELYLSRSLTECIVFGLVRKPLNPSLQRPSSYRSHVHQATDIRHVTDNIMFFVWLVRSPGGFARSTWLARTVAMAGGLTQLVVRTAVCRNPGLAYPKGALWPVAACTSLGMLNPAAGNWA